MHYAMVAGYPLPAPFGGHPALELCNTWSGWDDPPDLAAPVDPHREYLADPDRLAVWLGHAGLADAVTVTAVRQAVADHPRRAAGALAAVRELRSAAYPLLLGEVGMLPIVATYADAAVAAATLRADAGTIRRVLTGTGPERALHAAALAVESLLTDPDHPPVRRCPGQDCGWLFLDRTGRRKWCSMTSCGNRAKVRAFDRRHPTS